MLNLRKPEKDMTQEELAAYRRSLFGYKKPMNKKELGNYRQTAIFLLCGEWNIDIHELQDCLRLIANDNMVDIYPGSCKFHDIKRHERGIFDFDYIEKFIKERLRILD